MMDDPTPAAWPHWMLRYIGSGDGGALEDLVWSVGGSPPDGGVSYEEAAAVFELLEDYTGPGEASEASYRHVESFLQPGAPERLVLDLFRCMDQVQSDSGAFGLDPVRRGLALAQQLDHRGSEAAFLCFEADWYARAGDVGMARDRILAALGQLLDLADQDDAYADRAAQCATNAISFTAMAGDRVSAERLFLALSEVLDPKYADQFRQVFGR